MEQDLKIIIRGDVVGVTKSLNDLEKEFKELEKTLKTKTGQAFIDANKQLDDLALTMQKVKNIGRSGFNQFGDSIAGAGKSIKSAGAAAQGAAPALFSLGQVARDLPFGFIAIQNNLPLVADSFGALVKGSGGLKGALSALGGAIAGPAGITFAFGALIAGVTVLIQKYGSVGAAIDALLKSGDKLYKQQLLLQEVSAEANKNAGTEIARYQYLATVVSDTALSLQVRKDAVKQLQEQYGAYLGNLSEEDILNGRLSKSTAEVTKQLQAKALAQAAVAKAGELSSKVLDSLEKEDILQAKILKKEQERVRLAGSTRISSGGSGLGLQSTADPAAEVQRVIDNLEKERQALIKNRNEIEAQITALFGRAEAATAAAGAGAISGKTEAEKLKEAQRIQDELSRKAEADLKKRQDAQKELLTLQTKRLEQELSAIPEISDKYLALQRQIAVNKAQIQLIGEQSPATVAQIKDDLAELLKNIEADFKAGRIGAGKIDFTSILDLDPAAAAKKIAEYLKAAKETAFSQAAETSPGKLSTKAPLIDFGPEALKSLQALDEIKGKVGEVSGAFATVLAPAIDSAFSALESGKNVLQAVGESFKKLLIQIALTVAKAAILAAIISAIPGGAAATGAGAGAGFGKILGSLLGFGKSAAPLGGGSGGFGSLSSIAAPNVGGVGAGGFNLNITGAFFARGTDLAGVVAESNKRISRAG